MTTGQSVEEVAAGLTKAQRAYLTNKAQWVAPVSWMEPRWMTFPPRSTHRVLVALGLADWVGQLSDSGTAVRNHLLGRAA